MKTKITKGEEERRWENITKQITILLQGKSSFKEDINDLFSGDSGLIKAIEKYGALTKKKKGYLQSDYAAYLDTNATALSRATFKEDNRQYANRIDEYEIWLDKLKEIRKNPKLYESKILSEARISELLKNEKSVRVIDSYIKGFSKKTPEEQEGVIQNLQKYQDDFKETLIQLAIDDKNKDTRKTELLNAKNGIEEIEKHIKGFSAKTPKEQGEIIEGLKQAKQRNTKYIMMLCLATLPLISILFCLPFKYFPNPEKRTKNYLTTNPEFTKNYIKDRPYLIPLMSAFTRLYNPTQEGFELYNEEAKNNPGYYLQGKWGLDTPKYEIVYPNNQPKIKGKYIYASDNLLLFIGASIDLTNPTLTGMQIFTNQILYKDTISGKKLELCKLTSTFLDEYSFIQKENGMQIQRKGKRLVRYMNNLAETFNEENIRKVVDLEYRDSQESISNLKEHIKDDIIKDKILKEFIGGKLVTLDCDPTRTYSLDELKTLSELEFPCYILENGKRTRRYTKKIKLLNRRF